MTTIKLKSGSGAPLASDLVAGEPALDLTNKRLYTEDSGGTVIEVGTNPTSLTTGTFTSTGIDDNATSTAITIDSSENVGIGTTSPATILDVREESTGGSTQIRVYNTDNSNTTTQTASLFLSPDSRGNGALVFAEKENADFSTSASRDVALVFSPVLNNSQTEAMRIDSSGNVGIGTTSPSYPLDVVGPIRINHVGSDTFATIRGPGNRDLRIDIDANGDTDSFLVRDLRDGSERFKVQAGGNVGIGTASPSFISSSYEGLHVNSSTTGASIKLTNPTSGATGSDGFDINLDSSSIVTFINRETSGIQRWYTGGSERMRIASDGGLLINTTTTPSSSNFGTTIGRTGNPGLIESYRNVSTGTVVNVGGTAGNALVRGDGDLENTNNSYGAISDERVKSNIVDASSQLDDIMAVQVRSYTLNATGATHIGVVAQELEASGMSGLVKTDDEGMKSVKYSLLYMKAIKALQEAVTRIETLEAEVAALKGA